VHSARTTDGDESAPPLVAGESREPGQRSGAQGGEGARGALLFMASRIVLIACGFATYALVARKLTTAEFGVYGVVGAIVNISWARAPIRPSAAW
jgi:hypothetical protein